LVPRVQAMIILGESGSPEALNIYEREISDPNQTLWVKLWALEGISNIKHHGGTLPASAETKAAKIISDFLDDPQNADLPWPVKLRALEALGSLRQGFLPTAPKYAHMANTAMRFLTDPEAKLEVRSEAARALGLMPISTTAVPKYNFALVAHSVGKLAVELGTAIDSTFSILPGKAPRTETPSKTKDTARRGDAEADQIGRAENLTKTKYLTALLIGPVYEAFNGNPQARDSGLLHTFAGTSAKQVQSVFQLIEAVAQSAVRLADNPPSRQIPGLKKTLASQVDALRNFLEKNPPEDRHLVPDGPEFPSSQAAGAWLAPAGKPLVGLQRGR
jgi:hypothetical protein